MDAPGLRSLSCACLQSTAVSQPSCPPPPPPSACAQVFGKDRAAFKAQPAWRQQLVKKQVGLW
jgi:hypothetical protein